MNTLFNKSKNILVLGDIMMDVNIHGSMNRMANEAPIPILVRESENRILGGCGNVLMNLQSLGCAKLFIISRIGNDSYGKEITTMLSQYPEIEQHLYVDDSYSTVVNFRGFSKNKIMFRYDIENKEKLVEHHIKDINDCAESIITNNKIDVIIFSDYNRGFLVLENTQHIIQLANKLGIPTLVDNKSDYTKYKWCTLIKPNMKEVYDIFGIKFLCSDLDNIHKAIKSHLNCNEVLITMSEKGMSYSTDNNEVIRERAIESEVIDVTGAGDVVLSIMAYYYSAMSKQDIIKLATYIGTISVQHVGVYIVKRSDILKALKRITKSKELSIEEIKYLNTPIVFTNGCFDVLHEGHMALLQYCSSIRPHNGEVIIAINSDESIKRLKGPMRPINDERARVAILNNIETVDWILVFTEDTPYEILQSIRPHTLVKGGDYTVESLVGIEFCENVKIFTYLEGKSSTSIINRIRESK